MAVWVPVGFKGVRGRGFHFSGSDVQLGLYYRVLGGTCFSHNEVK